MRVPSFKYNQFWLEKLGFEVFKRFVICSIVVLDWIGKGRETFTKNGCGKIEARENQTYKILFINIYFFLFKPLHKDLATLAILINMKSY